MIQKIMNFLFGKKPPIFNSKGKISHDRKTSFEAWQERYKNNDNYNWKNHSGMNFQPKDKIKE